MNRKELTEEEETQRIKIRQLCYKRLGTTYNEIELFLLNRFGIKHSVNDGYFDEWIIRLCKPNFLNYMDLESKNIWYSIVTNTHKWTPKEVNTIGQAE